MRKTKRTKRTQRRTPLLDDDELGDDDFLAINNPIITSTPTGVQPSVTDDMPKGLQKMMEPTMRHMHSTLKAIVDDGGMKFLIQGGTAEGYRVPKSLLRRLSSVFGRLIDNDWSIEEHTSVYNVPKADTVVRTIFLYWLCAPEADLFKELSYSSCTYGIKCVIFADKYDVKKFHDMVMPILTASKCVFPIRLVKLAYETNPQNPIRKFVIQRIVHAEDFHISRVSKWQDLDGKGFLIDILKELANISHRTPTRRQ